jgi:hypothetical protein
MPLAVVPASRLEAVNPHRPVAVEAVGLVARPVVLFAASTGLIGAVSQVLAAMVVVASASARCQSEIAAVLAGEADWEVVDYRATLATLPVGSKLAVQVRLFVADLWEVR